MFGVLPLAGWLGCVTCFTEDAFLGFLLVWGLGERVGPVFAGFCGRWGLICAGTRGRVMSSESPRVRQLGAENRGGRSP